ncbi:SipW-dependent-type signal peptide-containing protein [Leucobacter chromiireducens]|uniref:SipW-dependent-type signal peptide-containing protein n=1 Tax=Leucobacter chromiireducens TaxID=283877 RepID=UPI000F6407A2|nr:SipW-dependent-type signal peptide-containing protein [Leucobacter chromiireducens]
MRGNARSTARAHAAPRGQWFTRARAVLAGALVLGVGGSLTLAAWTDTETVQASFAASVFGIEGSSDGTNFSEHPAGGPATLSFTVTPTAMSPDTTSYASFTVRTTSATTVPGSLALSGAVVGGSGLGGYLRYGVVVLTGNTACNAGAFAPGVGTTVVPQWSQLATAGQGTQPLAAGGSAPVRYCFAVTLPAGTANAAQGLTASATWTFTAASTS